MTRHRVVINRELCEGHFKCQATAPEVFEVRDEDDQAHLLMDEISDELMAKVDRAIRLCPRGALSWVEEAEPLA